MLRVILCAALVGVGYVGWRWHTAAVILLAALLPTYFLRFEIIGIPTNFLEAAVLVVFTLGVLQPHTRKQWRAAMRSLPRPIVVLTGLLVLAAAISIIISPHLETSLGILKGWIITPIIYAFMVYCLITNYQLRITNYLIASGVVMALLGLSQLGTVDRVYRIYDVPNSLALFLVPLIVLNSVWPLCFRSWNFGRLPAAVMFLALLATGSLAGVLSVLAVLAVFFYKNYPAFGRGPARGGGKLRVTNYQLLFLVTLLALTAMVALPKLDYLLQTGSSAHVRLQLWDISIELIREHPLLGIGLGTFEPFYQKKLHERFAQITNYELQITNYPLPEFVFRDPHNWVLSFWLNTGLLGIIAFAGLHIWVFWKYRPWQPAHYALLSLLVFGLVDTIFWKNDLATLHFTLLVLAMSTRTGLAQEPG